MKKLLFIIYSVLSATLLALGFAFEEPYMERRTILVIVSLLYMLVIGLIVLWGSRLEKAQASAVFSLCLVMMLLILEVNSKYAVNYFYHTLYLLLIFFTIAYVPTKLAVTTSGVVVLISFIKFVQLIMVTPSFANVALMIFFASIQILIVVTGIFLEINRNESVKMKKLYEELQEAHDQLKAYTKEIKELSKIEAKNVIARDLHDTLGHDMTGLIMQMEMVSGYLEDDDVAHGLSMLEDAKTSARSSLVRVREIVETLKNNDDSTVVHKSIRVLVNDFATKTGCQIHFDEKGKVFLNPKLNLVLFRVIQEALTNAVRHGQATIIYVTLIYTEDKVTFIIEDNGQGANEITFGNGLKGMQERLVEVGGTMTVKGQPRFCIKGEIKR